MRRAQALLRPDDHHGARGVHTHTWLTEPNLRTATLLAPGIRGPAFSASSSARRSAASPRSKPSTPTTIRCIDLLPPPIRSGLPGVATAASCSRLMPLGSGRIARVRTRPTLCEQRRSARDHRYVRCSDPLAAACDTAAVPEFRGRTCPPRRGGSVMSFANQRPDGGSGTSDRRSRNLVRHRRRTLSMVRWTRGVDASGRRYAVAPKVNKHPPSISHDRPRHLQKMQRS
jgi:hypothetical protein